MSRAPATARRDLLATGAVLVLSTVLTAVLSFLAVDRVQHTADKVRVDTVPALVEVSAARRALVDAERAVVTSFDTGAVRLSGPGGEYRAQIVIATQNLTQAATHDLGDDSTRASLSFVNSLLTTYMDAVDRAAGSFRDNATTVLWASDLWDASRLLHAPGGALTLLDRLLDTQVAKLDRQVDTTTATVIGTLWRVLAVLLLTLLVGTLVWLAVRFHRALSPGLAGATLLVAALLVLYTWVLDLGDELHATRNVAHELTATWERELTAADRSGQAALVRLVKAQCPAVNECGSTLPRVETELGAPHHPAEPAEPRFAGAARLEALGETATGHGVHRVLIPGVGALAVLLIGLGLSRRFNEYRFRSR